MGSDPRNVAARDEATRIIRDCGGIIRTSEALRAGIHPRTLYSLRDRGDLEQISRGLYRLTDQAHLSSPDLVTVAKRIPQAVICLASALDFHEITTQIPRRIAIALPKGAESPRISHPPLSIHRFSKDAFTAGMERHDVDGIAIRVYSPEKTLADCFKFRNRLGMDVVLEALRLYRERRKLKVDKILAYARVCRVEKVMKPYLEAML